MTGPTRDRGYLPIYNDLKDGCEMILPECWDMLDNDEDGYWDYGYDKVCQSPEGTTEASCGNNVIELGEECDDNNGIECIPEYDSSCTYCNEQCSKVILEGGSCGDGTLDEPQEECDDGNNTDGDGCSADCVIGSVLV